MVRRFPVTVPWSPVHLFTIRSGVPITAMANDVKQLCAEWWSTALTDIAPGSIRIRGYAIEELLGRMSYAAMAYLLIKGELPSPAERDLLDAVLVAGCDHGPHAPSIAAARMAATTGITVNSAMAVGINMLGDVHGGAGRAAMELLYRLVGEAEETGRDLAELCTETVQVYRRDRRFLPGFGHRFHREDPRAGRLFQLLHEAQSQLPPDPRRGRYVDCALHIQEALSREIGRPMAVNVDGATAAVLCELQFPPEAAMALFVLSRGLGIAGHVLEQLGRDERVKGPMPRSLPYRYAGPEPRPLPHVAVAGESPAADAAPAAGEPGD